MALPKTFKEAVDRLEGFRPTVVDPIEQWYRHAAAELQHRMDRQIVDTITGKNAALGMLYGAGQTVVQHTVVRTQKDWEMAIDTNETRFRSFCERYVIARCASFRADHEEEDSWTCMLNAKSAYRKIEAMGRGITKEDEAMQLRESGQTPSVGMQGATACPDPYANPPVPQQAYRDEIWPNARPRPARNVFSWGKGKNER